MSAVTLIPKMRVKKVGSRWWVMQGKMTFLTHHLSQETAFIAAGAHAARRS